MDKKALKALEDSLSRLKAACEEVSKSLENLTAKKEEENEETKKEAKTKNNASKVTKFLAAKMIGFAASAAMAVGGVRQLEESIRKLGDTAAQYVSKSDPSKVVRYQLANDRLQATIGTKLTPQLERLTARTDAAAARMAALDSASVEASLHIKTVSSAMLMALGSITSLVFALKLLKSTAKDTQNSLVASAAKSGIFSKTLGVLSMGMFSSLSQLTLALKPIGAAAIKLAPLLMVLVPVMLSIGIFFANVMEQIQSLVQDVLFVIIQYIGQFATISRTVFASVMPFIETFMGALMEMGERLMPTITGMIQVIGSVMKSLFSILNLVVPVFETMFQLGAALFGIMAALINLGVAIISALIYPIVILFDALNTILAPFVQIIQKIAEIVGELAVFVSRLVEELMELLKSFLDPIIQWIADMIGAIVDALEAVREFAAEMNENFKQIYDKGVGFVEKFANTLIKIINTIIRMINKVKFWGEDLKEFEEVSFQRYGEGKTSKREDARKKFTATRQQVGTPTDPVKQVSEGTVAGLLSKILSSAFGVSSPEERTARATEGMLDVMKRQDERRDRELSTERMNAMTSRIGGNR